MKLISLQLHGVNDFGWSSEKLLFADRLTQIYGENGAGKTPLVKSIVFALGYKAEYRDDILERCDRVTLEVVIGGKALAITRSFQTAFWINVVDGTGRSLDFNSEREFSRFMLELWELEDPIVTTTSNKSSHLYVSQLLPLFYLDQSHGYAVEYHLPQKFIKDQYAEVMRLANGLAPKNAFDKRRARAELQVRLEYLDRAIVRLEDMISDLTGDIGGSRRPLAEMERDLQSAMKDLALLQESGGATDQVVAGLDAKIAELQTRQNVLARERSELEARVRGFSQIRKEINAESDTLVLNEEARRVFASFDEICAKEGCGLFVRSSTSYGKSLLYLKDQIKDLERSSSACSVRVGEIAKEIANVHAQIESAEDDRNRASGQSTAVGELVNVVAQLTERVISLRRDLHVERELLRVEADYVERLDERGRVQLQLDGLTGGIKVADVELIRLRTQLASRIASWLQVLRTPNVSRDVIIDNDFNVTFGGQRVSKFSGSTLTRLILAIRTAAFEVVSARSAYAPKFLILDTPRQQDIAREDLANFIVELRELASSRGVQVVYSTTNHRYALLEGDAEWLPTFPGPQHQMFLGDLTQIVA